MPTHFTLVSAHRNLAECRCGKAHCSMQREGSGGRQAYTDWRRKGNGGIHLQEPAMIFDRAFSPLSF